MKDLELNYFFNQKDKQKLFCKKCKIYTDHYTGLAWNHDISLYLTILCCEKCRKDLKKQISYESFKEARDFAKLSYNRP